MDDILPASLRRFHFVSGLPRSAATLPAVLLHPNPRLHADISRPLTGPCGDLLARVSAGSEMAPPVGTATREHSLNGPFTSDCADSPAPVMADVGRACAASPREGDQQQEDMPPQRRRIEGQPSA